ncbi:MAG: hypothetical protein QOG63_1665 [Thermoleophilaceae bacterium]|nr:hypothetical protein [Thermoleophilaceae bacterium]
MGASKRSGLAAAATAVALLSLPASAFGWRETVTRNEPGGGPATCLRDAGGDELSLVGPVGRRSTSFDLLAAGARLAGTGRARFGIVLSCPAVAENADGASALATVELGRTARSVRLRVATRTAHEQALHTANLARPRFGFEGAPAVAVGPSGDMAVAWVAHTHVKHREPDRAAIFVARRPPGGAFGAPQRVAEWHEPEYAADPAPVVGIDAQGTTTVAWATPTGNETDGVDQAVVSTATGARDQSLGAPARLTRRLADVAELELAVTPTGEALLAVAAGTGVRLFERRDAGFVSRRRFAPTDNLDSVGELALAEAPDGSAVIAWRTGYSEEAGVTAVRRTGMGPFGAPVEIARPHFADNGFSDVYFSDNLNRASAPDDRDGTDVRAAISPAGEPVVTWVGIRAAGRDRRLRSAYAARGRGAAAFARTLLGSPCRPANATAPVTLPDGRLGAAWTDNLSRHVFAGLDLPEAKGRLHLALADQPPDAPGVPPRVTVTAPRMKSLDFEQPLRVRVSCDRACDIRAFMPPAHAERNEVIPTNTGAPRATGTASLSHAGSAVVKVRPGFDDHVADAHGGRTRVFVHACTPGGTRFSSASAAVRAIRRPVPPLAHIVALTARRHGRRVVVRWRTDRPALHAAFVVLGRAKRKHGALAGAAYREGRGRTRFRATLKQAGRARIRSVAVVIYDKHPPHREHHLRVRVR